MKLIKTEDAVGAVLAHDMTQIIRGVAKDARFRKGHIVKPEDIQVLLSMGKESIYIYEAPEGYLHENDAAEALCALSKGDNMTRGEVKEGKIELFAECDGLFTYDAKLLQDINSIGEISIAARGAYYPVHKGDKLAGMRVIPLVIDGAQLNSAARLCGEAKLFSLYKYHPMRYGIVATGSEISKGRIKDSFSPVVQDKLAAYACECMGVAMPGDDKEQIIAQIRRYKAEGAELIVCTGGMSVDPDDRTPAAIKDAGADIISYGAPVLPGAMFLMAYLDGVPLIGLPGCVMYAKRTVLDIVLPRIMARLPVTREQLVAMGAGGLCLSCEVCHFPNCSFGR